MGSKTYQGVRGTKSLLVYMVEDCSRVFIFRQSGFRQVGLTFEQFLLVVAAVGPSELSAT